MYSTVNMKIASCDAIVNSEHLSVHCSSLIVVLCSDPMAVKHQ